jgi:hypothetical protein
MSVKILTPIAVRNEPEYIQVAYIREFQRIKEQTDDILVAKHAADTLLVRLKHRQYVSDKKIKQFQKLMTVSISAHISEMSAEDCVPIETLKQIKAKDPQKDLVVRSY